MSLAKSYDVCCDKCGRLSGHSTFESKTARAAATKAGWKRRKESDVHGWPLRVDVCPKCVAEGK